MSFTPDSTTLRPALSPPLFITNPISNHPILTDEGGSGDGMLFNDSDDASANVPIIANVHSTGDFPNSCHSSIHGFPTHNGPSWIHYSKFPFHSSSMDDLYPLNSHDDPLSDTFGDPADGIFRKLPHELISAIFNALPKLSRYQCLFLNRRLSRVAAACLWRSIGCWAPCFPESRLSRVMDILESDMHQPKSFCTPDSSDHSLLPRSSPKSSLSYPYLSFIRKIVIMIYNISNQDQLFLFITRVRRVLLQRCFTTRRLTLAYRGPLAWALDADLCNTHPELDHHGHSWSDCRWASSPAASILRPMTALSQLGIYWVTEISAHHLVFVSRHCSHLRLLHIQPDRSVHYTAIHNSNRMIDSGDRSIHYPPHTMSHSDISSLNTNHLLSITANPQVVHARHSCYSDTDALVVDILQSNGRGKLHELNLWHLPVTGGYFSAIPLNSLRMLTLGNFLIPESALLALSCPLPMLTALTVDHPRSRPRRVPFGVAHFISLTPNLNVLYLKHVVFSQSLAQSISKCSKLTSLTLAPTDARALVSSWVDFVDIPPPVAASGSKSNGGITVSRELLGAEMRDFPLNLGIISSHCKELTTLDLAGGLPGAALLQLLGAPKLRDLRIKHGGNLCDSDIRQFVTAVASPCIGTHSVQPHPITPPLRTLHINAAMLLTDPGVFHLVYSIPTLRYLTLVDSLISREALWFLASHSLGTLKKLTISGPSVHPRDIAEIRQRYPITGKRIDIKLATPRPVHLPHHGDENMPALAAAAAAMGAIILDEAGTNLNEQMAWFPMGGVHPMNVDFATLEVDIPPVAPNLPMWHPYPGTVTGGGHLQPPPTEMNVSEEMDVDV